MGTEKQVTVTALRSVLPFAKLTTKVVLYLVILKQVSDGF